MSKLIALVFDDPYKADEARAALLRMEGEGLCEIDESAVISKKEGENIRVSQDVNMVADRQQTGQTLGILAATLTGTLPLIGVGKLIGKLVGRFTDNGVTNSFIEKVKKELGPNTSALLLYITSGKEGGKKVIENLRQWSPKVLDSDLPEELEQEINNALQGHKMESI
jgi:uncharacterized membrane protein